MKFNLVNKSNKENTSLNKAHRINIRIIKSKLC